MKQQYIRCTTKPPTSFCMFRICTEFPVWEHSSDNYCIAPSIAVLFQAQRFQCFGRAFSKDIFIYMAIMFPSSIRLPSGWAVRKALITGVSGHPLQNGKFRSSVQGFTSDFTASKGYWFYSEKRRECFECFNDFTFLGFVPVFQSWALWPFQMGF